MLHYYLIIVLAPLLAAVLAGLFGRQIGRVGRLIVKHGYLVDGHI